MSEEKKGAFSKFWDKLKRIKHLDIILTVLFIAIVLLIYFSSFSSSSSSKQNNNTSTKIEQKDSDNFDSYVADLTSNIERVIESMYGVGSCKVMLYFDEGIKTEIAYTNETKTQVDGTKVETKSPVLLSYDGKQEPIVLQYILPKPTSVVVVASGAKDTNVKLEILRLVQSMLDISSSRIEIFAGN